MPSPRSVLADITDLGLNPAKAHKATGANGRIKAPVATVEAPKAKPVKVSPAPVLIVEDDDLDIEVSLDFDLEDDDELTPVVEKKTVKKGTKKGAKKS